MSGLSGMGMPLPPLGADPSMPLPADPMGMPDPAGVMDAPNPMEEAADPGGMGGHDLGSIAGMIASLFAQVQDLVSQADPMLQALMGGMNAPVGATPAGGPAPVDPMMGFGAGAGMPVDPNALPPVQ